MLHRHESKNVDIGIMPSTPVVLPLPITYDKYIFFPNSNCDTLSVLSDSYRTLQSSLTPRGEATINASASF